MAYKVKRRNQRLSLSEAPWIGMTVQAQDMKQLECQEQQLLVLNIPWVYRNLESSRASLVSSELLVQTKQVRRTSQLASFYTLVVEFKVPTLSAEKQSTTTTNHNRSSSLTRRTKTSSKSTAVEVAQSLWVLTLSRNRSRALRTKSITWSHNSTRRSSFHRSIKTSREKEPFQIQSESMQTQGRR